MKTLKKSDKELISKVNEFRDAASTMSSYSRAATVLQELSWFVEPTEREMLGEAWRNGFVDNSTEELNKACDAVIKRIQNVK